MKDFNWHASVILGLRIWFGDLVSAANGVPC